MTTIDTGALRGASTKGLEMATTAVGITVAAITVAFFEVTGIDLHHVFYATLGHACSQVFSNETMTRRAALVTPVLVGFVVGALVGGVNHLANITDERVTLAVACIMGFGARLILPTIVTKFNEWVGRSNPK